MRPIHHRYEDPLSQIWVRTLERMGVELKRSSDVFASFDGQKTLVLGTVDTLDADDCLAQMVFHELCHSLVQGPESFGQVDWGLDNESDAHRFREYACLRVQAALLAPRRLRRALAPTTDHRAFYDALPANPLQGDTADAKLARIAHARHLQPPWHPHLVRALDASHQIIAAAAPFAEQMALLQLDPMGEAPIVG